MRIDPEATMGLSGCRLQAFQFLVLRILPVVPCPTLFDEPLIHNCAVVQPEDGQGPSIAILTTIDQPKLSPKHQFAQRLLGTCPESLPFFRSIDSGQTHPPLFPIDQDPYRIAIHHTDNAPPDFPRPGGSIPGKAEDQELDEPLSLPAQSSSSDFLSSSTHFSRSVGSLAVWRVRIRRAGSLSTSSKLR